MEQLSLEFPQLCWSHLIGRYKNKVSARLQINRKVNVLVHRNIYQICGKQFLNFDTIGIDSIKGDPALTS